MSLERPQAPASCELAHFLQDGAHGFQVQPPHHLRPTLSGIEQSSEGITQGGQEKLQPPHATHPSRRDCWSWSLHVWLTTDWRQLESNQGLDSFYPGQASEIRCWQGHSLQRLGTPVRSPFSVRGRVPAGCSCAKRRGGGSPHISTPWLHLCDGDPRPSCWYPWVGPMSRGPPAAAPSSSAVGPLQGQPGFLEADQEICETCRSRNCRPRLGRWQPGPVLQTTPAESRRAL